MEYKIAKICINGRVFSTHYKGSNEDFTTHLIGVSPNIIKVTEIKIISGKSIVVFSNRIDYIKFEDV